MLHSSPHHCLVCSANDSIAVATKRLGKIARILRARRIAAGALLLASPEVKFLLDHQSQQPSDVEMYQLKEANALVEEYMLLGIVCGMKEAGHESFQWLTRHCCCMI